jgi:hypothetical protein
MSKLNQLGVKFNDYIANLHEQLQKDRAKLAARTDYKIPVYQHNTHSELKLGIKNVKKTLTSKS